MENNVKQQLNVCQEVANDNCVLDTIKINTKNLRDLEKNLNEIIEKIMG